MFVGKCDRPNHYDPVLPCPTAYLNTSSFTAKRMAIRLPMVYVPGKYLLRLDPFAQWTMAGMCVCVWKGWSTMGIAWAWRPRADIIVSASLGKLLYSKTTNRIDAAFNCEIGNSTDIALHLNSYPTSGTKRLNYTERHYLNWHVCSARLTMAFLGVYRDNTQDNGSLPLWKITTHHYGERYHRGTMSLSFFPLALKCVHKNNYGGGTRPCTTLSTVQTRSSTSEQRNKT